MLIKSRLSDFLLILFAPATVKMTTAFLPIKQTFQAQLFIKPISVLYGSASQELATARFTNLVAEIVNESGLDSHQERYVAYILQ